MLTSEGNNNNKFNHILLGVPFKYSSNNISYPEAVRYAGLVYDLILYSKKVLDDFRKNNHGNMSMRLRLKSGMEIIVVQGILFYLINILLETDFYLITLQLCNEPAEDPSLVPEGEKKN
jgi:hypothetical protein